jgi:hypothetical protein
VLAANIFFANGPATVVDNQPISSGGALELIAAFNGAVSTF